MTQFEELIREAGRFGEGERELHASQEREAALRTEVDRLRRNLKQGEEAEAHSAELERELAELRRDLDHTRREHQAAQAETRTLLAAQRRLERQVAEAQADEGEPIELQVPEVGSDLGNGWRFAAFRPATDTEPPLYRAERRNGEVMVNFASHSEEGLHAQIASYEETESRRKAVLAPPPVAEPDEEEEGVEA